MNLKEKVLSMKPSQLVMSMVEGLKNEYCVVDMNIFGKAVDGICFGCAATNAIQGISGLKYTPDNIKDYETRAEFLNVDEDFLYYLEMAFDELREGEIDSANCWLKDINYPYEFPETSTLLPALTTENYKENLQAYINYANEIQLQSK